MGMGMGMGMADGDPKLLDALYGWRGGEPAGRVVGAGGGAEDGGVKVDEEGVDA